ncbi:capsid decoration protein [Gordonia phage SpeedDemon]|uniref:Capsid decoration protein n=1 Tax=Gordonia phage Bantam TaxID=1887641 RepID=A0A1B3AY78_9CAUD|nr:head decoration [Gordonia phage Bantam]AOE43706.1 capsid decoration protein [Gordonia phage Bantam]QNL30468.1 capsid decoration protein [Gordonia phage SpeedDemon]
MTDIALRETARVVSDNKAWVYADIGKQASRRTVTLDITKFTKATHYPDGFIRSGVPLGKVTATGKYGPFDPAATDGREDFDGFLWNFADVVADQEISVNAIWDGPGTIRENKLPLAATPELKAAAAAVPAGFKFVTA